MTDFAGDLERFVAKLEQRQRDVFVESVNAVMESVQTGSPVTGAPGQPVGQYGPGYHPGSVGGDLRASWQETFPAQWEGLVATNAPHAESNEDGIARPGGGDYKLRSTVGGRHSVLLTRLGWSPLVDSVVAEVVRD